MTAVRRPRTLGALLAAVVLLAGCGQQGGTGSAEDPSSPAESSADATTDPSTEPTESTTEPTETESTGEGEEPEPTSPACSEVWKAGQSFPQRYDGCFDEEKGRWVQAMVYRCSSGQHLVTYGRTFYAAKGEQVVETEVPLARDPEFKQALATCGA